MYLEFIDLSCCRAFDVEMLYLAQVLGIPIAEVAVEWQEIEGMTLNITVLSSIDFLLRWNFFYITKLL